MMLNKGQLFVTVAAASLALAYAQPSAAKADFAGRTITIYVGFSAGGGYDANGRLFAAHIGRFLPGSPTVITKNMPGAGSRKVMAYLYNVAAKDGTEFGIVSSNTAFHSLFKKDAKLKYEPEKMSWIGSLDNFTGLGFVWAGKGLNSLEDARKKQFVMAADAPGGGTSVYTLMVNDLLGTKFKRVLGYVGSREISAAIERGEADGMFGWCWSCINADKPAWVKEKKVNIFMQLGLKKNPGMPDVPLILDLLKNDEDKRTARVVLSNLLMARPFVGPPGLPAETLTALRSAFDRMVADARFLASAKKARRPIKPVSGKEIEAVMADVYTAPKNIIARAATYYK